MANWVELTRAVEEFDIVSYLEEHQFQSIGNNEWVGDCPHCRKERKVAVNSELRRWHCWVCQEVEDVFDEKSSQWRRRCTHGGGGLMKLIMWLEDCEFREAVQIVTSRPLLTIGHAEQIPESLIQEILDPDLTEPVGPPDNWEPITPDVYACLPYLHARGISFADVQTYGLFWCRTGWLQNRFVFPVWERGRIIYWQARAMFEREDCPPGMRYVKTLNPKKQHTNQTDSSQVLGNIEHASMYPRVCVVEGPTDVMRSGPDTVCTFGKQFFPRQVTRLLRYGVRALDLMWDGPTTTEPEGAHPEMLHVAPWLSLFFDVRLVFLPRGDPGDWAREALLDMRSHAAVPADSMSRTARI